MLKMKLHYFVHLMLRSNSLEKTLMGNIEGRRRRGQQRVGLNGVTNSMDMNLGKLQEIVVDSACYSPLRDKESERI